MMDQRFVNVRGMAVSISMLFVIIGLLPTSESVNDALQSPANVNCVCPGEKLTFMCTINEGGTTLWTGTAFTGCSLNEILLRHSQFSEPEGAFGRCNNGAITGRSIGVIDQCYSSMLNVTVSSDFNGETIRCNHDGNGVTRTIGVSTLNVVTAMDPPSSVQLTSIQNGQAQFRWTPVDSCIPVIYDTSTNCSTLCSPMTTDLTNTNCSVAEPTTDVVVCDFSVQSVVCDNLMGNSHTAVVTFQAQGPSVNLIPHYSADNKSLSKFTIRGTNLTIAMSDSTPIFIREYDVSYTDPTTGSVLYSTPVSSCGADTCNTGVSLSPPSLARVCPSSVTTVDITVTADTGFGHRPLSDPIATRCTNQFVNVQYNSSSSTITCIFLNQMDTSQKSCSIVYGKCNQGQTESVQGSSTQEVPNRVILTVMFGGDSVCYNVTASNSNYTLVVDGIVMQSTGAEKHISTAAIVGIVVPVCILMIIAVFIVVVVVLVRQRKKGKGDEESYEATEVSSVKKLKLRPIQRQFKKYTMKSNGTLREALESHMKVRFKQGRAYYEFVHKIENISEDKEIIFMDKDEYFTPTAEASVLKQYGLRGDGAMRQSFEKYKVFVQSTGSGARHLPSGSILLYEHAPVKEWKPEDASLMPITSKHFTVSTIENECTLEAFRTEKKLESPNILNIFLESCKVDKSKIERIRDVILMDKENKNNLFTGPFARSNPHSHDENKWRVFILSNFDKDMQLPAGSTIIHQNPRCMTGQFHVLRVNEDYVQMSEFVEKNLGVKFENGKAFYELTQVEEDLLFYKEVVQMPKSVAKKYEKKSEGTQQKQHSIETLDTNMKLFYWIPGAPKIGVKGNFEHYKAFVQSTSQGSRCLRSKKLLLYKVQDLPV